MKKSGFTLLEVLVASLLLGMLVTILTMIFNQSSVAWRTGVAGVADLDNKRQNIAMWHVEADEALPGFGQSRKYRVVSPWDEQTGTIRTRALMQSKSANLPGGIDFDRAETWQGKTVQGNGSASQMKSYTVGVTSAGPDGQFRTADDISTWPKNMEGASK